MPNTIQHKRSATPGAVPATLSLGELALNYADGKLFYKNAVGAVVPLSATAETFESVSKNLRSYPATYTYSSGTLTAVTYAAPGGSITKTLSYTDGKLTSITLSGGTPSGVSLTKTLTYTGDALTGVSYS